MLKCQSCFHEASSNPNLTAIPSIQSSKLHSVSPFYKTRKCGVMMGEAFTQSYTDLYGTDVIDIEV